jgi:hypothetical protein
VTDEHMNEAPVPASAETSVQRPNDGARPYDEWARAKATERWWIAAAAMHARWALGREVNEAEYDAAVRAAKGIEVR